MLPWNMVGWAVEVLSDNGSALKHNFSLIKYTAEDKNRPVKLGTHDVRIHPLLKKGGDL